MVPNYGRFGVFLLVPLDFSFRNITAEATPRRPMVVARILKKLDFFFFFLGANSLRVGLDFVTGFVFILSFDFAFIGAPVLKTYS